MRLTKRAIDTFHYEGRATDKGAHRDVRWDEALPGFGLRIYPSGTKAFVLSYRINGDKRLMTLGPYGVLTLDQARKRAKAYLAGVEVGDDPLEEKQRLKQGETVADLCEAYIERHAKAHKRTWRSDKSRIDRHILPAWRRRKASSITRANVAALHRRIGKTHRYEANRTLLLTSKMFNLALSWGFVPGDFQNPAKGIDQFHEDKRDRWITPDELPRLAKAIDAEPNVYIKNALWLFLLTGARKSELLRARWSDMDFSRKELRLPETKAGRVHYLALSPEAVTLLRELPRQKDNPHLFPGRNPGRPLVNISKAWRRIRKHAGIEDVRLHDLRRTVGSWLAQSGNSLHLIGKILGHSNAATTQVYARFAEDSVRNAMDAHSKRLLGAAGKGKKAEVRKIG